MFNVRIRTIFIEFINSFYWSFITKWTMDSYIIICINKIIKLYGNIIEVVKIIDPYKFSFYSWEKWFYMCIFIRCCTWNKLMVYFIFSNVDKCSLNLFELIWGPLSLLIIKSLSAMFASAKAKSKVVDKLWLLQVSPT